MFIQTPGGQRQALWKPRALGGLRAGHHSELRPGGSKTGSWLLDLEAFIKKCQNKALVSDPRDRWLFQE